MLSTPLLSDYVLPQLYPILSQITQTNAYSQFLHRSAQLLLYICLGVLLKSRLSFFPLLIQTCYLHSSQYRCNNITMNQAQAKSVSHCIILEIPGVGPTQTMITYQILAEHFLGNCLVGMLLIQTQIYKLLPVACAEGSWTTGPLSIWIIIYKWYGRSHYDFSQQIIKFFNTEILLSNYVDAIFNHKFLNSRY